MSETTQELSFGQKAVGLKFNHAEGETHDAVHDMKQKYADVIDALNDLRESSTDGEVKRLASAAITEAQGAQMWAVKALTWEK